MVMLLRLRSGELGVIRQTNPAVTALLEELLDSGVVQSSSPVLVGRV
jgi:hypothetical protein